jgi:hypothetical protein
MPTSAIEYDVKLTVLVAWLRDEFGEPANEQGAVVWSVTVSSTAAISLK